MSIPVSNIIYRVAKDNVTLSNQEIWNMALEHTDKVLIKSMIDNGCVHVKQVRDYEKINAVKASRLAEIEMCLSANPGNLSISRAQMIANASIQDYQKGICEVEPGDRYCRIFMECFEEHIQKERKEIQEKQRQEAEEDRQEQKRRWEESERRLKFKRDFEKYNSPEECEKRNAVKRTAYNQELAIYQRKIEFLDALDELYFVAHAPGDYIHPRGTEMPFQRRTKADKEAFEKAQKPKEPTYEKPNSKPTKLILDDRYDSSSLITVSRNKTVLRQPLKDVRPLQFHEQKLEVFEQLYFLDKRSYLERLERALVTLNRESADPLFANTAINFRGQSILVKDILFNKKHPHYQMTPLKNELEARRVADQEAKLAAGQKLREEMEMRNQRRLEGRHADVDTCARLKEVKDGILVAFYEEKILVKTHRMIQNHNNRVAIQLFRQLYQMERRSILGQMHYKVESNSIYSFSEILTYAFENQDYFESKTRGILRKYKAQFEQILYAPLHMQFEVISKDQVLIEPSATFTIREQAEGYARWYRERCPKHQSDNQFIADFSEAYKKHVQDRMLPVLIDKMRKWVLDGEIFSYEQLTRFAELNPNSEVANILKTTLARRLAQVKQADQAVQDLTIHSESFIETKTYAPRDLYERAENLSKIDVKTIYDFSEQKTETYTPPKRGHGDRIEHLKLYNGNPGPAAKMFDIENTLYQVYEEQV